MPGRKASGIDAWTLAQLRLLPAAALESLADILTAVEAVGTWPAAWAGARMVFIPKGEGNAVISQRPIGILPMIYRLWARVRLGHGLLERWVTHSDFEHGRVKGRSAMEAAWDSALEAELAGQEPTDGIGAVLLHLSKCCERIPL